MNRFWKRHDGMDVEAQLRDSSPQPRREFVEALATRVSESRPRTRQGSRRIALAGGLSAVMLIALAATGGLSYAGAGATKAVKAAKRVVDPSGPQPAGKNASSEQYGKRCGNPHEEKPRKIKSPPCPVQAGNAKAKEGNSGTTSMTFPVTIGGGYEPEAPVAVGYTTSNGTALAGSDYVPASGTITFAVGETAKSVTVQVIGDTVREPDEAFSLLLLNPSASAQIADGEGVGTITNDDKR